MSTPARKRLLAAGRPGQAAAALAGRHGAADDSPALRKDLVIRRVVQMGEVTWVVKNPQRMKYYNFGEAEWGLIQLFDGTRTRTEIFEEYRQQFPTDDIKHQVILDFEESLRQVDLIEQSVAERNLGLLAKFKDSRRRAAEEKAEGSNVFFIPFHVLDPNRFLNRTVKYVRWIWTPRVVVAWSAAALWTISVFVLHWQPIWAGTMELYAFLSKPLIDAIQFFCILSIIGCIHEFGHAYAVKIYGGDVHDIGVALLYFTPAFYCDSTDSLLFENKWHKLWVMTAGIYVEGFICSAATALWVLSYPDSLLHELAYKTMLFTGVSTVFFNINPLIKIDGYYALSSLLEIPELREESFRYLGARFQRHLLRLPVEIPQASRRKRRIYWIYGSLALAYIGVVMAFIGGLFHNFYFKYFPNLAVPLLILTLLRIFRKRVRLVTRTARLFYIDKKDLLMSPRSRKPLLLAAALILAALVVPWSHRKIRTNIVLEPWRQVRLEAPEDAIVAEVFVGEGDTVRPGQVVFRLASPSAEAEGIELASQKQRLEKQASGARGEGSVIRVFEAERRGESVDSALRSDAMRLDRLLVRSPIEGRIQSHRLQDLKGRFVEAGAMLAEVGDCRKLRADLEISERRLDELAPGEAVIAMLPGRPLKPAHGTIVSISPATLTQPHTARAGADPAAPSARPERFLARAVFENADESLVPGMAGRAKVYSRRASPVGGAWRMLRRWLETVLW